MRCKTDPKYNLGHKTCTALWMYLKEHSICKHQSTFILLGYTIEELMTHLECLFTEGMTWENYGKWYLNHIKPMALFQFKTTEYKKFKDCWLLNNLQPLWASDNLSKGTRYNED